MRDPEGRDPPQIFMQTAHYISLGVALVGGLWMYHSMQDQTGAACMYLFSMACGGAGSRIAAILRKGI